MGASTSRRRITAIPRRIGETGTVPWRALSRAGRVSAAGVAASALLAVALGVFIPRVAEHHAVQSRLHAMRTLVRVLEEQTLIPAIGDPMMGSAYARFDRVVQGSLLGGENLRVKLWNRDGEIVYSDEPGLVGRRFPVSESLGAAFVGEASAELSDLSELENVRERVLADQLLEFYVPLRQDDRIIGVFEVYQDMGPLAAHMMAIRVAVWIAVGTGLSILLAFLSFLFVATSRSMTRERMTAMDRAEDLALLLGTAETLAADVSTDRAVPGVLARIRERLRLHDVTIELEGSGARTGPPRGPTDGYDRLAVPIRTATETMGTLVAWRETNGPLGSREQILLAGLAAQLGAALENGRLFRDLRQVTEAKDHVLRRLVDAQEQERRHLVGDLHDGVGQTLTRILHGLRGARARLSQDQTEIADELDRLEMLTDEQSRNLRRYMATIGPAVLEDFGIGRALEAFVAEQRVEAGMLIDLDLEPVPELAPAAGITLFRAAQEAVMNARKHADATRLGVHLSTREGWVILQVTDDGRGAAELRDGVGLTYMRDRAASLGGIVDVRTAPGRGTTLTVRVPAEGADGVHG